MWDKRDLTDPVVTVSPSVYVVTNVCSSSWVTVDAGMVDMTVIVSPGAVVHFSTTVVTYDAGAVSVTFRVTSLVTVVGWGSTVVVDLEHVRS